MLSPEQINQLKNKLIQQIESNFPEDKKEIAKQQVESMNQEQFEEFLKQNNLIKNQQDQSQQCIFCSIVSGKNPSYKIDENANAIAVLEINPISKGHILVIPKEHFSSSEQIPEEVFSLAKKLAQTIKEKLKPKEVSISSSNLFGHEIINIFPIYKNENQNSPRHKISQEELEELQKELTIKEKPKNESKKEQEIKEEIINEKNTWLPKRIP